MNNVGLLLRVYVCNNFQGTVEERIRMAGELGFSCIQLPSKVLYKSFGINRSVAHELA